MSNEELYEFREALGFSESGNNYYKDTGNYWGKYQFGEDRRKDIEAMLGLHHLSREEFNEYMQEKFFMMHIKDLETKIFNNGLDKYFGKEVIGKSNGIKARINKFGIIAGAHIGGFFGVKNFLENGVDKKDSFGTYISDYVAKFSDIMEKKSMKDISIMQQYFSQLQQSFTTIINEVNKSNDIIKKIKEQYGRTS